MKMPTLSIKVEIVTKFQENLESPLIFFQESQMSIFLQESIVEYPQISAQKDYDEINLQQNNCYCNNDYPILGLKKPRKKRKKQSDVVKKRKRRQSKNQIEKVQQSIPFSPQEDQSILLYVLHFGPKFMKIAKFFPTKTINMVKNRYYKMLRYKWDSVLGESYAYLNEDTGSKIENVNQINYRDETQIFRNQKINVQI
ncbi:unnamed protein product (macronuclear) [Paramecium tetraurelia]|uniref:Myb-like domain-containing protein n=1 Tax=Paramecium tetraurelia TaxID=5888 RepID=A0D6S3_PARTE|nr:uncharacterized protein GSPATT00001781001 [Paramecium tetraurelia]CAK78740.1 unnamed protein product [Paramecium tetraurelia]|eukprot:XP_001446137.1 hypothetical protein (macronuclear) [Paramecium tetraurelia strain d4-2]